MEYKLLSLPKKSVINIGDYVQALASSQFLPSINGFIDREDLCNYNGELCKVIMNGWFMHNPLKWPPSKNIIPLFVAFHLNTSAVKGMLSEEGIKYLKEYEPIGCRDYYTRDLLIQHGIEAYFSGCMTLTLGLKYHNKNKDGKCYFVDPTIIIPRNPFNLFGNLVFLFAHYQDVKKITKKLYKSLQLKRLIRVSGFLKTYMKVFTKDTIVNAEYISQESSKYADEFANDTERLQEAERLIKKYSTASLVVTSRIHCALPCLGLETPVIYTAKETDDYISTCRFGGLIDLFNVVYIGESTARADFKLDQHITVDNTIVNKQEWRSLADKLALKCKTFIYPNEQ